MKIIAFSILFIVSFTVLKAQTDSLTIVENDTVVLDASQEVLYRLFVETPVEDPGRLWKVNLVDVGLVRLNITYEGALGENFSSESYISFGLLNSSETMLYSYDFDEPAFDFEQQLKFYYNFKRRERLNKPVNEFSGNYFSASFGHRIFEGFYSRPMGNNTNVENVHNLRLGLKYGMQRRIGSICYIELFAGVYYQLEYNLEENNAKNSVKYFYRNNTDIIDPVIGIRAGFAIDSFKNLRKALNP